MGYRYLETDVHASADGTLFAFHDEILDRVTDGTGRVAALTAAQVRQARVNGTDPIPTLDEVLEEFPGVRLNIDVKAAQAVAPLIRTLQAHNCLDRVCVGSFSDARVAAVRRALGPHLATSAGPRATAALRLAPAWMWQRLRTPALAVQIPLTRKVAGRVVRVVTPDLIQRAHEAGKQVHVWTIDQRQQMHQLFDLGIDGIVTDRIDVLRDVLRERGRSL